MKDWMKKEKASKRRDEFSSLGAGVLRQWEQEGWKEVLGALLVDNKFPL